MSETPQGEFAFIDWLRSRTQIIILSDTCEQFAAPLMRKLGWPTLFCHRLEVAPEGRITGYRLRIADGKRKATESLRALNFRVVISGPLPDISVSGAKPGAAPRAAVTPTPKGTRKAYFPEAGGYLDTPVYDRYALAPGAAFAGPAIIEERESTTVAGPGARVTVDARLTLVLEP